MGRERNVHTQLAEQSRRDSCQTDLVSGHGDKLSGPGKGSELEHLSSLSVWGLSMKPVHFIPMDYSSIGFCLFFFSLVKSYTKQSLIAPCQVRRKY